MTWKVRAFIWAAVGWGALQPLVGQAAPVILGAIGGMTGYRGNELTGYWVPRAELAPGNTGGAIQVLGFYGARRTGAGTGDYSGYNGYSDYGGYGGYGEILAPIRVPLADPWLVSTVTLDPTVAPDPTVSTRLWQANDFRSYRPHFGRRRGRPGDDHRGEDGGHSPVPLPAPWLLLGSALMMLGGLRWWQNRRLNLGEAVR